MVKKIILSVLIVVCTSSTVFGMRSILDSARDMYLGDETFKSLNFAVIKGDEEQLRTLLKSLPKERTAEIVMLLNIVVMEGDEERLRILLKSLPDERRAEIVMSKNSCGITLLHSAVGYTSFCDLGGITRCVKCLLEFVPEGQIFNFIMSVDECKYTVLHYAARVGCIGILMLLINAIPVAQRFSAVKARTLYGHTALHVAVEDGKLEIAKFLLKIMTPQQVFELIMMRCPTGPGLRLTVFEYAVAHNQIDFVKFILDSIPENLRHYVILAQENSHISPLQFALNKGYVELKNVLAGYCQQSVCFPTGGQMPYDIQSFVSSSESVFLRKLFGLECA